jgi:sterol desaturase/sphingolipid hydroxylase (fatty acid hydroxylase superfamily)
MALTLKQFIIGFGLFALLASLIEGLILTYLKKDYNWRAAGASLFIAAGRRLTDLVPLAVAFPGGVWLYENRIFNIPVSQWWAWLLLFFGLEFFYYWYHRAAHRTRWFWASHSVHHSPNEFTFSAAYRLAWTSKISMALVFYLPLAWLGFPPQMILAAYAINLLYQFWIHAEWIPKLGVLEGVLNTPSAHRVHHGANLEYLDVNYGGILLVFDRLFGTYRPERNDVVIRYGLVEPQLSNNPIKILFSQWVYLIRDVVQSKNFLTAFKYLVKPPGWSPHGDGKTTEDLKQRLRP